MRSDELLARAMELVQGDRQKEYGDKHTNFRRIATLWNQWMLARHDINVLNEYDVAMMMLLLKVARLMNTPGHRDSHADIAGYVSIMEELFSEQPDPVVLGNG